MEHAANRIFRIADTTVKIQLTMMRTDIAYDWLEFFTKHWKARTGIYSNTVHDQIREEKKPTTDGIQCGTDTRRTLSLSLSMVLVL